jgi:hypothetical protein
MQEHVVSAVGIPIDEIRRRGDEGHEAAVAADARHSV